MMLGELPTSTTLEVSADQALVWTSYRDDQGNLVIELPNSVPAGTVENVVSAAGLLASVDVSLDEGASRPLTRLTVKTRQEADHTLSAEGNGLKLELFPVEGGAQSEGTLVAESAVPNAEPTIASSETMVADEPESMPEAAMAKSEAQMADAAPTTLPEVSPAPRAQAASGSAPPAAPPDSLDFEVTYSDHTITDPATILEGISLISDNPGTAVKIRGDGEFSFSSFRLENPDRFVVDLTGVVNASAKSTIPVASEAVDRVRIAQFKPFPEPVARVVFDLPRGVMPRLDPQADGLIVRFGDEAETAPPQMASMEETAPEPMVEEPTVEETVAEDVVADEMAPPEMMEAEAPAPEAVVADRSAGLPTPGMVPPATAPAQEEVVEAESYQEAEPYQQPETYEEAEVQIAEAPAQEAMEEPFPVEEQEAEAVAEADSYEEVELSPLPEPVTVVAVQEAPPAPALEKPVYEATEEDAQMAEAEPLPAPPTYEAPEAAYESTPLPATDVALFEAADLQLETQVERNEPAAVRVNPEVVGSGGKVFTGDPISMSLKNADIKDVLRSFSGITGLNVVVHPGVNGSVTVELDGVPWDQALDLILKINKLDYVLEGNIMRIAKTSDLENEAKARARLARARAEELPLDTVIRSVSYASAGSIARLLTTSSGGNARSARSRGRSILSARGGVTVDQRTNKLIIKELPGNMDTVLAIIDALDTAEPQVLIEARIVETTKSFTRTLGIQWDFGAVADDQFGNTTGLQFPHRAQADGGVNLLTGGNNALLDVSLGNILDTFNLDLSLQAAENEGLVSILSAPKITTLNNQRASIQSGLQIPIQTVANNTVSVQFVNATLSMEVTPQVTAEGTVLLDINIAKREPQLAFAIAGAANAPISTKQARTRVIVRDGGTTVIGGIYEVSNNQGEDRVPGLANVPILGHLFKNRRRNNDNEELLIFITPRVIQL